MKRTLLIPAALIATLAASRAASIYTADHGDLGIAYEAGELEPHYHLGPDAVVDGSPVGNPPDGVEFAPDELITFVADPSFARPAGAQWNFIGSPSGAPIWFLPQEEDPGKPFFGIGSEELTPGDWTVLSLSLTAMTGPAGGHFSLYETDGSGSPTTVRFATSDGITGTDSFNLVVGGHEHYNWAFTEPGIYELEFTITGNHVTDGPKTATTTYTFGVTVPEPDSAALGLLAAGALLRRRR